MATVQAHQAVVGVDGVAPDVFGLEGWNFVRVDGPIDADLGLSSSSLKSPCRLSSSHAASLTTPSLDLPLSTLHLPDILPQELGLQGCGPRCACHG